MHQLTTLLVSQHLVHDMSLCSQLGEDINHYLVTAGDQKRSSAIGHVLIGVFGYSVLSAMSHKLGMTNTYLSSMCCVFLHIESKSVDVAGVKVS